jgi:hypothetical protein
MQWQLVLQSKRGIIEILGRYDLPGRKGYVASKSCKRMRRQSTIAIRENKIEDYEKLEREWYGREKRINSRFKRCINQYNKGLARILRLSASPLVCRPGGRIGFARVPGGLIIGPVGIFHLLACARAVSGMDGKATRLSGCLALRLPVLTALHISC